MAVNTTKLLGKEESGKVLDRLAITYKLTEAQKNYVHYFVETGGDRMTSLLKAGYSPDKKDIALDRRNKSAEAKAARSSLSVHGSILMKNKKILQAIKEYKEVFKDERRREIEQDVYRITKLRATYNPKDMICSLFGDSPEEIVEKFKQLPDDVAVCIDGIDYKYHGSQAQKFTVSFKLADRDKNIALLAKLTGMMVDRKEVEHKGNAMPTINIAVMNNK